MIQPAPERRLRLAHRRVDHRRRARVGPHVEDRTHRSQLRRQRHRRLVALIEALRQRLGDDRIELDRQRLVHRRRQRRLAPARSAAPPRPVRAGERQLAGQHLEHDDAEREDVGAVIDALAERLLGRHVRHGSLRRPGRVASSFAASRALGAAAGPVGEAEVEDLRVAFRRDDDVRRLDVAVDDAVGVRVGERVRDLHGEVDRAARVHRPPGDHGAAASRRGRTRTRGTAVPDPRRSRTARRCSDATAWPRRAHRRGTARGVPGRRRCRGRPP